MNWFEIVGAGLALLSVVLLLGFTGLVIWSGERDLGRPITDGRPASPYGYGEERSRYGRLRRKLAGTVERIKTGAALALLLTVIIGLTLFGLSFVLWFVFDVEFFG